MREAAFEVESTVKVLWGYPDSLRVHTCTLWKVPVTTCMSSVEGPCDHMMSSRRASQAPASPMEACLQEYVLCDNCKPSRDIQKSPLFLLGSCCICLEHLL